MTLPRWEPDGTQAPPPPRVWNDPVAGLVTGFTYLEEDEQVRVHVVKPEMPDISAVRRAVDAVLLGDDEPETKAVRAPRRPPSAIRMPADTPGMVAPNPRPGWPRSPSVRQLAGLRSRRPSLPVPPPKWTPRSKPGATAGGIGAIIVVIGVLLWIVISIISGLVETLFEIFN